MSAEALHPVAGPGGGTVVEGIGKQKVGELGLPVARPFLQPREAVPAEIAAILPQIPGNQLLPRFAAGAGTVVDDARLAAQFGGPLEQRPDLVGQQEMRQVVRLHLHVEAVDGGLVGHAHDAGIVAQDVASRTGEFIPQPLAGLADAVEARQVARDQSRVGAGFAQQAQRTVGAFRGTVEHDDPRTEFSAGSRQHQSGAGSAPGDQDRLAGHFRERTDERVVMLRRRCPVPSHGDLQTLCLHCIYSLAWTTAAVKFIFTMEILPRQGFEIDR